MAVNARAFRRFWFLTASAMLISAVSLVSTAGATQFGVTGSVQTIRPDQTIPTGTSISLSGARNEFVSLQVPVRADTGTLNNVTVELQSQFQTAGGAQVIPNDNVKFYREDYYTVQTPSDGEIYNQNPCPSSCRWPDILIPERDVIYNQDRNAFPTTIPSGENRVAWVDILIPQTQSPGDYQGTVRVTRDNGGTLVGTVTVSLRVIDFTLPSTSSMEGVFATNFNNICPAHSNCLETGGGWAMYANYARIALENRVGLSNPSYGAPWPGNMASFNQYGLPVIEGTSSARLPGARIETILHNRHEADENMFRWVTKAQERGYRDRTTFYCDEVGQNAGTWNSICNAEYPIANNGWNQVPGGGQMPTALIGTIFDLNFGKMMNYPVATNSVNTLIPLVTRMDTMPQSAGWGYYPGETFTGNQRGLYDGFLATPGNRLWLYTSCMTEHCDPGAVGTLHYRYTGWPSYAIDQLDGEARAMAWQVFNYKATGEYYYQTVERLNSAYTANGLYWEGGQGDGTLFYPGTTSKVGGANDIPLESKRLKQIRDGREDYEFLYYLKNHGQEAQARSVAGGPYGSGAGGLFENMYDSDQNQAAYDAARAQLEVLVDGTQPPVEFTCRGLPATVIGTPANRTVTGTPNNDVIVIDGAGGFDIRAGGGDDTICGGSGYDTIRPGSGNDWVFGGGSLNALDYSDAAQGMSVDLAAGLATGLSSSESDSFSGFSEVFGGVHGDRLYGSQGADFLAGNAGDDVIEGRGGNDQIWGDPRFDSSAGADLIDPGAGVDLVDAGPGVDRVSARDGEVDTIDCGSEVDQVDADAGDLLSGCEGGFVPVTPVTPVTPVDPGGDPGGGDGGGVSQACLKAKVALKKAQKIRARARVRLRKARNFKTRTGAKKQLRQANKRVKRLRQKQRKACV